jgi:hypothetical protein
VASLAGVWTVPDRPRRLWAIPALLGVALALMLVSGLVLEPQIAAVQARIPSFLTDTDSPARQEFRRLHSVSSISNVIMLLLVAAAWVLTAIDPRFIASGTFRRRADAPSPEPISARARSAGD